MLKLQAIIKNVFTDYQFKDGIETNLQFQE